MNKNGKKPSLRIQKRLLQFNALPIAYGEIVSQTYTASFKGETTEYTALHGGYYPSLGSWGKLETSQFDAEIELSFDGVGCGTEMIRYLRFIKRELAKSGKLWAVQGGNEVIWANARVISINESLPIASQNKIQMSITFEIIDGFWVLASRTRTWLAQYTAADFVDFDENYCFALSDISGKCQPNGNTCLPCDKVEQPKNYPETVGYMPLCHYTFDELNEMFSSACPKQWAIKYSCEMESEYFCYDEAWGEKKRLKRKNAGYENTTTFQFCSRTDIPTELNKITLVGSFSNPTVTINGRTVAIEGTFDNQAITIGQGLEIYVSDDIMDPYGKTTSIIDQATFTDAPYFEINPGLNDITVSGNEYNKNSFIYIQPVEITF